MELARLIRSAGMLHLEIELWLRLICVISASRFRGSVFVDTSACACSVCDWCVFSFFFFAKLFFMVR